MGCGDGILVSALAIYSIDPSSNLAGNQFYVLYGSEQHKS